MSDKTNDEGPEFAVILTRDQLRIVRNFLPANPNKVRSVDRETQLRIGAITAKFDAALIAAHKKEPKP